MSVEDLSKRLFLSARQLQRIVKQQSGMALREIMMRVRLKRARELLKNPAIPIAEVAKQIGFASEQSFSRFFRKMDGEPPAHYRNSTVARHMNPDPQDVMEIDDKEMLR